MHGVPNMPGTNRDLARYADGHQMPAVCLFSFSRPPTKWFQFIRLWAGQKRPSLLSRPHFSRMSDAGFPNALVELVVILECKPNFSRKQALKKLIYDSPKPGDFDDDEYRCADA